MKKCPRCGIQVSIWQRDLFSGNCFKCRAQEVAEQDRIRQRDISASLPPCPDCGAGQIEIILFGRNIAVVCYTDADASVGWASRKYKRGKVRATICISCHRIFLHGVPLESPW